MIGRSSEANLFIKVNVILFPINSCIYMYMIAALPIGGDLISISSDTVEEASMYR